jgi:hypothetical protein
MPWYRVETRQPAGGALIVAYLVKATSEAEVHESGLLDPAIVVTPLSAQAVALLGLTP